MSEKYQRCEAETDKLEELIVQLAAQVPTRVAGLESLLDEKQIEIDSLNSTNESLLAQLAILRKSLENVQQVAEKRGLGQEFNEIFQACKVHDYLSRRVFERLYQDAIDRIARRRARETAAFIVREQEVLQKGRKVNVCDGDTCFQCVHPSAT
eukprot:GEMP01089342.1.p1 GENE.GEMP01089342.1~~GEMP01089342.1.p1  ORF type:complete len:153 (+),score=24.89 GEMP01089342.1:370-828(+)